MNPADTKRRNRRHDDSESEMGFAWKVVWSMGMPTLYIAAVIAGIIGVICNGVITNYWANLDRPICFLYSKTASTSIVYQFGSNIANCHWVTYGGVAGIVMAIIAFVIFWLKVREREEFGVGIHLLVVLIIVSMLIMLSVSCTMAEGMRITCASMGINSANNKGESCYEKLDIRVSQYNLPIQTSTMVKASMYSLWASTCLLFTITCFHFGSYYRRSLIYQ